MMTASATTRGLLLAACVLCAVSLAAPTTFSSMSYVANQRVHPFPTMPLPNYYMLDGATVSIEFGFNPGYDQLLLDYDGAYAISTVFSNENGVLYMSGAAPISEYASAIQSVVFTTSSADGANRLITFTFGQNTTYASSTEHFYRYVYSSTAAAWSQAVQDCSQRSFMGMQGYLATITSEREMTQVAGRSPYNAWVGGAPTSNGAWAWKTGPEGQENNAAGRVFWTGGSLYNGGQAPNWLAFDQWYRFQPETATNLTFLAVRAPSYENVAYFASADATDGIRSWICEFGGMDSAAVAATTWTFTESMLLQFDCSLFTTTTDCTNHAAKGCGWTNNACNTIDCSTYLLQSSCVADWRCDWFVNGEFGVCANTACSQYGNQASCQADPDCVFNNGACNVARCSDQQSNCACTGMDGCSWRQGRCIGTSSVGCIGMDVVYLLDGTVNMSQPFERYPNGFFGLTQMMMDSDLALTGSSATVEPTSQQGMRVGLVVFGSKAGIVSPSSIGSGGRITGLLSEMEGDFAYAQRTYSASVTTRLVGPALSQALRMFSRTTAGRTRVIVVVSSSSIDDAVQLQQQKTSDPANSVLNALATSDVQIIGVTLRPTEPQTVDSMAAAASLALLTTKTLSTTLTEFPNQVLYGMCGNQPLTAGAFFPMSSSAQSLCGMRPNRSSCVASPLCSWDNAGLSCTHAGCAEYCTQTACAADPTCLYSNNMCINKCASRTQTTCTDTVCQWNAVGGYCMSTPCISNPNEDACIADTTATCTYIGASSTGCVVTSCTYSSESVCLQNPSCMWSPNGGCFSNPCTVSTQAACVTNPQCQWASKCTLNPCGLQYQTEQSCQSDRNCQWNTAQSPAVCGLAPCSGLNYYTNAQQNCLANPTCYWQPQSENGFQDMCIVKPCSANSRACDCAAQDGCVWKDQLCRDTTFVQCPAMDVVFLIEATAPMGLAFGRHPNGFSGIVEAIRSWSLTAPLSQSIMDPGFRLAIAGYGSPTRAMQPGDVVLGRNFTASIKQWADVNMILDNFAKNQVTYAQEAPGQVAVGMGLAAAIDLFAMSPSNRQKLLIIMGNSQITDGTTGNLDSSVASLEAQGVQIFSNVIRRFSVITASENVAAEYLKPLATDPVETHYSFSTIDEMQANLLESFCDPSTTIGTALGVSRDGVLPCNWLTSATECGVQGSCYWNATAAPTCPQADQCPNMGCVALPPALAADFECKHCEYVGGAFSCNRQKNYQPVAGVCLKSPCSATCTTGSCSGACQWSAGTASCGRAMCQATDVTTCNLDLGCVWVDGTGCRKSQCGLMREATLCTAYTTGSGASLAYPCSWNTQYTPALCVEQRCMYMNAASCALFPTNCQYSSNQCSDKLCQFGDAESCSSDSNCVWNPFVRLPGQFGSCQPRVASCQLSDFSNWSPCTANCGANAIRYRSRTVVQFPKPGGASCADVAGSIGLTQVSNCSSDAAWQTDCNVYCSRYATSVSQCIADASCQWASMQCVPRPQSGCAILSTATACGASDMCTWDDVINFCQDKPQTCRFADAASCANAPGCTWRTGANSNLVASSLGLPAILVNPGQTKVRVFPTLALNGNDVINGATVTIENGYQIGKDVLQYTFPSPIASTWVVSSGTLLLSGAASLSEYGNAISSVTFYTSSMRNVARNITWSLGSNTLFSLSTGHYYRYYKQSGVTWDAAKLQCGTSAHFGLVGYLATITSAAENSLVATKLGGDGWISGSGPVSTTGPWMWTSGPEAGINFWTGGNNVQGGYAPQGQYANWNSVAGEPSALSTPIHFVHPYLNQSGYWNSLTAIATSASGYVCEFGGFADSVVSANFSISGAVLVGMGGCLPNTQCSYHKSPTLCTADAACNWNGQSCQVGCGARSTVAECSGNAMCAWSVTVLPPVCDADPCLPLGVAACNSQAQCKWNGTTCTIQEGCGQYLSSTMCNNFATCQWSNASCTTRKCNSVSNIAQCSRIPTCVWSSKSGCMTACRYTSLTDCNADSSCLWGTSSAIVAPFYSGGAPVLAFQSGTQSPTAVSGWIDGITVRIGGGFQAGQDVLSVDNTKNPGLFIVSFLRSTGVLQLIVSVGSQVTPTAAYQFLTTAVLFSTTSSSLATRVVTYAMSSRTARVGSTYYKILNPKNVHSLADANAVCTSSTLFGLNGVLATPSTQESNYALAQMNAQGIFGAYNAGGNAWAWSTNNQIFWSGVGQLGAAMNGQFSQWPVTEPKAGTSFARMGMGGMWFSTNETQRTYAVLCQYSGPQVGGPWGGEVLLGPTGCFPQLCAGLTVSQCSLQSGCGWSSSLGQCAPETWCSQTTDKGTCLLQSGCYWSYTRSVCAQAPSDQCQGLKSSTDCMMLAPVCAWNPNMIQQDRSSGACQLSGCSANPTQTSCTANTACRWYQPSGLTQSQCVARLCGYVTADECRADAVCAWAVQPNSTSYGCQFSSCSLITSQASCQATAGCTFSATSQVCQATPCLGATPSLCLADVTCLYLGGRCFQPSCTGTSSDTCLGPYCYFTYAPSVCVSAQCVSYGDAKSCQPGPNAACRWEAGSSTCRQATWVELQAPNTTISSCTREVDPDLTWLYIVLAVIFVLLVLIVWRLVKAFTENLNFFAPTKNNRRFRTHQEYASELFEENKLDEGDFYGDRMANEL